MRDNLIAKICDPHSDNRDLLVDELTDEIEAKSFNEEETLSIVHKLLGLLPTELDQSVHESIFNLLSGIYPSGIGSQDIESYVLNHIQDLKLDSLIHALSILSESELEERKSIFSTFTHFENEAIQKVANNYLSQIT